MRQKDRIPALPAWVTGVVLSFLLPAAGFAIWAAVCTVIAVVVVCLYAAGGRKQEICLLIVVFLLGAGYAVLRTQLALSHQYPAIAERKTESFVFTVQSDTHSSPRAVHFRVDAKDLVSGRHYHFTVSDYRKRDWPVGSRWQVQARVKPLIGENNRVGFNREAWALANRIDGSANVSAQRGRLPEKTDPYLLLQQWRSRLGNTWAQQAVRYTEGTALLKALAVGDQQALPDSAWQVFRPLGLNHLVSISGLHVGMLALLAGYLMRYVLRLLPLPVRHPVGIVKVAAVAAAVVYSALAGFAVPTQRSLLMIVILAWALWRRQEARPARVWWTAMAAVLLFDPLAVLSVGFWLSFLLVAALMFAGSGRRRVGKMRQVVTAQWAAGMASLLLVAWCFGTVPVLSPLVNMVAIPWFTLVLVPVSLLSAALPLAPFTEAAAWLCEYTMRFLYEIARYALEYAPARAPFLLWIAAFAALPVLLLPRGLRLWPAAVIPVVMLLTYRPPPPAPGRADIIVWDVGQGLSVTVRTHRHSLIFDTGTEYAAQRQLIPNLQAAGIRRPDILVLSHNDSDHDGGAGAVRQSLKPGTVFAGQPEAYAFSVRACREGINWTWDGVWFEFLNLPAAGKSDDKNGKSCVLRVVAADKALLVTGDLGIRGERALLNRYGSNVSARILILGHHGSRTSSAPDFIRAVAPDWAVVSAGINNSYGHPHTQVRALLRAESIPLLRTDLMGGLQTELGSEPVRWWGISGFKPYWQRKPLLVPEEVKTNTGKDGLSSAAAQ